MIQAQQSLMDDGDCIDADAAPAAMEIMTPPDGGIANANDEDVEQENSIAIDEGNEKQVDEQDVGPDESSDSSEREEVDPDADGQQEVVDSNNVHEPSSSDGKQKQKDDPKLSLSQFCGHCLWRQTNLSCDQKAQVIAKEYPAMTLDEVKLSILSSGCMRNGDSETNHANASKSYQEKSRSSTMIIPIFASLVLALGAILTIQARENKKLKEEILSLRDNNRELGGGNYSDNPDLVPSHGLEDMGKPSNIV